ncbi:MAG: hypothetical protein OEY88_10150 [Candidatus Bathyarchaeota archaeon]|nr:hypothetical protein [Candidatus Bathyarchaeota archaeon]
MESGGKLESPFIFIRRGSSPNSENSEMGNVGLEETKLSESLQQRIKELDQLLTPVKEEADKLGLEAKTWMEKRNSLNTAVRKLRDEAVTLREKRDSINEEVKDLKRLREEATLERKERTAQISELKERLKILLGMKPSQTRQSIQEKIKSLEWRIQTTSLSVKEEEPLIDQIRVLESQLLIHQQIKKLEEDIIEKRAEEKTFIARAQQLHEKLSELARQSQTLHEKRLKSLDESRSIKSDADDAHQEFLEIKQKAEDSHEKCVALLHRRTSLQQELRQKDKEKQAQRQVELREEFEAKALTKLKQGDKLTWEEFKILADQGKIRKLKETKKNKLK